MVRVAKMSFLFLIIMVSAASAQVTTPVTASGLNELVQGQINPKKRSVVVSNPCDPICPYGWVKFDGRCFSYFANQLDWATAEAYCLNLGANLVSIHSENEYQMVKALVRAYNPQENPTWLGLSNCQKKNSWIWSDGTTFGYSKWNPNEPNHNNNECCVHFNWANEKNWNDIPCELLFPFVCAKKLV